MLRASELRAVQNGSEERRLIYADRERSQGEGWGVCDPSSNYRQTHLKDSENVTKANKPSTTKRNPAQCCEVSQMWEGPWFNASRKEHLEKIVGV